jgi:hypothetical protein
MRASIKALSLSFGLLSTTFIGAAHATDYPNGGVTGAQIAADLQSAGLKATATKDPTGDPMVEVKIPLKDVELPYTIYFFDCKDGRCGTIEFSASFKGKVDKIPQWNKDYRYARAYANGQSVHVEYDVDVERGANSEMVRNSAERFSAVLIESIKFLGEY